MRAWRQLLPLTWVPRFYLAVVRYQVSGLTRRRDSSLLIEAFCRTQGGALSRANGFARITSKLGVGRKVGATNTSNVTVGQVAVPSMTETLSHLQMNGWASVPKAIKPDLLESLAAQLETIECLVDGDEVTGGPLCALPLAKPRLGERYSVSEEDLLSIEIVQELSTDPTILEVAQGYLGTEPILDFVAAWWSFPSERPSATAAQMFHFDMERLKWLKVFIPLTPVTEMNGAHVFVDGTHKDGAIPRALLRQGYARLTDESVQRAIPEARVTQFHSDLGDILFEDTRGLHKGQQVLAGHRLMLQFQYCSSLFGIRREHSSKSYVESRRWTEVRHSNPRVLVNFPAGKS